MAKVPAAGSAAQIPRGNFPIPGRYLSRSGKLQLLRFQLLDRPIKYPEVTFQYPEGNFPGICHKILDFWGRDLITFGIDIQIGNFKMKSIFWEWFWRNMGSDVMENSG